MMGRRGYRGNVLLVELIVVVLFFSLSAVISLGVFVKAREVTTHAQRVTEASAQLSAWAETLALEPDPEAYLETVGFIPSEGVFTKAQAAITYTAKIELLKTSAGLRTRVLLCGECASYEAPLSSMVAGGYFPKEAQP